MLFTNLFNNESCLNDKYPEDIVKSVDDRFNETDLKIKRIEDKLQTVLNKLMTEFNELKGQSLTCTYEKRISILEETNRKLERDNEKLTEKFIATTCVVSDLNTKIKDLENEKKSLLTTIKLIQIHDKHVNIRVSNKSKDVVDLSSNTVIDNHDSPVRVDLSTDEEIATNQTSHQHALRRKYKSKKKRKAVKPLVSSSVGDKIKEMSAHDLLSKSTQTTQSLPLHPILIASVQRP